MAETTGIGWTDSTFNPWIGCTRVSKGCVHCYAEDMVINRMGRGVAWGPQGVRQRTKTWGDPVKWERNADAFMAEHGHRQRVFCASLADVFEPLDYLDPWRRDLFELIAATPSLDWQLLTKRPEVAHEWYYERGWVLTANLWLGVSIEDAYVTHRADTLREIPAAVRFISAEPLVGSLFLDDRVTTGDTGHGQSRDDVTGRGTPTRERAPLDLTGIDWVIVGGESGGRDARPMHPEWARELRDACLVSCDECEGSTWHNPPRGDDLRGEPCHRCHGSGVDFERPALFFKQWGSWRPHLTGTLRESILLDRDGKVRNTNELSDFALPVDWARMEYLGKQPKAGGKLLDGREWCEFPERQEVMA